MKTPKREYSDSRIFLYIGLIGFFFLFVPKESMAVFQQAEDIECINCHKSLDDKRLKEPVTLWSKSVHSEVGNTCDGCHGGDPDDKTEGAHSKKNNFYKAPDEEEVAGFCGKCHRQIANNFMQSMHGLSEVLNCIYCHGSHTIQRISVNIINEDKCTECHEYDGPKTLKGILVSLHEQLHGSESTASVITGFPMATIQSDIEKSRKKLREFRMLLHIFDIEHIKEEAKEVDNEIKQTKSEINRLLILSEKRSLLGYILIPVFLLLAVVAYVTKKNMEETD